MKTQYLEMVALRIAPLKLAGYAVITGASQHVLETVAILDAMAMEYVTGHPVLGW
jgi:hypothetical protein